MNGWARAGAALGGRNSPHAYMSGAQQGAQMQSLMLEARKKRDAEIGRQALAHSAFAAGDNELGNYMLMGGDPRQLSGYQKDQQAIGWGDEAMALVDDPANVELINRMNLVREGKPVDLTKIQGHVAVNPMLSPESQGLPMTELGQAMIGREHARAGAYGAQANASNALAAQRRAGGGPGSGAIDGVKPTALTKAEIEALFGEPGDFGVEVDPAAYRQFLAYQARMSANDPRFRDARFAAQAWANQVGVDPGESLPGTLDMDAYAPAPRETAPERGGIGELMQDILGGGTPDGTASAAGSGRNKYASDAARPTSQDEFDALPTGALFINPADGRLMRKK